MRISFLLILFPIFAGISLAQSDCPQISIVGPEEEIVPGEKVRFSVDPAVASEKYAYKWSVDTAFLASSDAAASVDVKTTADHSGAILAITLTVEGLPQGCGNSFTLSSKIQERISCGLPFDEFSASIPIGDEFGRLDSIVVSLSNNPAWIVYFVIRQGPNESDASVEKRIARIKNHISKTRRFSLERVFFVRQTHESESMTTVRVGTREALKGLF